MKFATKLTALFIGISVIVIAVLFTVAYFQAAKILKSEIEGRMKSRVIFTMDALDRFLYTSLNDIKIITGDKVIISGTATAEEITARLIFYRNTYKSYVSISFFNLERIRIADTAGLNIGEQNRMTRYWEDVLAGRVSAASDVHISEDFKAPVVYFASTVTNKEGKILGVVVARILKNRLFELVKRSMGTQEEEEKEEEIDIVNKDGLLIYSSYNREGMLKENLSEWELLKKVYQGKVMGSGKHRHTGKEETIYAFCQERGYLDFKGNGWVIISHIPTRIILRPVNKLLNMLIIMFLGMLPVLALIISLFSKTITRPLVRLSSGAVEIGKGKLDTVLEVKSRDEFGSLANIFNQMTGVLKKQSQELGTALKEALKSRDVLIGMLDDNNQIRQRLEKNIEDLKLSQEMFIQSEKMASLGRLISDISHEVNNPLMIISSHAQLALMPGTVSGELKGTLELIVKECQRAADIMHRILKFAQPSKGEMKEVDISKSIETVINIIEKQFEMAKVKIKRNYPEKPIVLSVDNQLIQEVFMNLLNNAKEAMVEGGTITITVSSEGDFAKIDFKDTGCGMSEEVRQKMFEPFFTTKEKGTGLGLSICYGIIKAHNGELKFESQLNKSSIATVLLPLKGEAKT